MEAALLFNLLVLFDLLVNLLVALFCWVRLRGVALSAAHLGDLDFKSVGE